MKRIDPGQAITILANLGVIAGIVLLAIELNQNNDLMAAQARFNRLSVQTASQTLVAENGELAAILDKANRGEALSSVEQYRASAYNQRVLSNVLWSYQELPESELPIAGWRVIFSEPPLRATYEQARDRLNPEFVAFIDQTVLADRAR